MTVSVGYGIHYAPDGKQSALATDIVLEQGIASYQELRISAETDGEGSGETFAAAEDQSVLGRHLIDRMEESRGVHHDDLEDGASHNDPDRVQDESSAGRPVSVPNPMNEFAQRSNLFVRID